MESNNTTSTYQLGNFNEVSPFSDSNSTSTPTPSLMQISSTSAMNGKSSFINYEKLLLPENEESKTNNNYQSESQIKLLDQKALNELLNVNVYQLAQNRNNSPQRLVGKRKNSDEDIYVEETLHFIYDPNYYQQQLNDINHVEVHQWDEDMDLDNEQKIMRSMMDGAYADQEIDKLLETFSSTIKLNGNILNGEYIENDIRLSDQIRDAIDEIKQMQRPSANKVGIIERRRFLQRYMETAELLDVSFTVEHLLPCLYEIFKQDDGSSEKEYTKFIFQNLSKLIDFLGASEITVGYNGIRDHIMLFFNDFFQSEKIDETLKQDIQGDVIDLLVKVSKFMTNEDRTEKILPIILECIRDDSDEEKRILGLELVDKLAEQVGKDNCQNFLMYEIVSLQDDPIYRVRKETISRMINISKVLGKEIFIGILFPVFKKLANDQIWGVRRSAVEQLPNIAALCPTEIKNGILIEMFKKFASDSSKWVKMAAFQYLGPFIATYEGIEPNPVLVDYYISMCEQNKSMQADNEVPFHCAYNFPAVLHTLGPKSWEKLHKVYDQLVKDSRSKVRRTLAYSLHEIAKILGPEQTERELIHVLYHFLKDTDEVAEGAILNLPKFIQVLSPEQRETYIEKIAQTDIDSKDWRKRVVQSNQIKKFSKIFSAETVFKFYVPIFFQLCQDQVAEVRKQAAQAIRNIALKLRESDELFNEFILKVVMFKQSNKFNLRQTFIDMCGAMMHEKTQDIFKKYLMNEYCQLQRDRIINVRMHLSESLFTHYTTNPNGGLVQSERSIRIMIKHLKLDSFDVSEILEEVEVTMMEGDEEAEVETIKQQQNIDIQEDNSILKDSMISTQQSTVQADDNQVIVEQDKVNIADDDEEDQKVEQQNDDTQQNVTLKINEEESNQKADEKDLEEQKSEVIVEENIDNTQQIDTNKNNLNEHIEESKQQQEDEELKTDDSIQQEDMADLQIVQQLIDEIINKVADNSSPNTASLVPDQQQNIMEEEVKTQEEQ
eukprot:403352815